MTDICFESGIRASRSTDMAYFTVLLRYIHQNPAKAGIVQRVKDYEYSSWGEFDGTVEPVFQICDTRTVLNRIPFKDLEEWVNEPLDDEVQCLDNDDEKPRLRLSDDQVWQEIIKIAGVSNSSSFQQLEKRKTTRSITDAAGYWRISAPVATTDRLGSRAYPASINGDMNLSPVTRG